MILKITAPIIVSLFVVLELFASGSEAVKCFQCAAYAGDSDRDYCENEAGKGWTLISGNTKVRYYGKMLLPGEKSCGVWAADHDDAKYQQKKYGVECEHGCLQLHTTDNLHEYSRPYIFYRKGCWDKSLGKMDSCQVGRLFEPERNITQPNEEATFCVCNKDYCNNAIPQPNSATLVRISTMPVYSMLGFVVAKLTRL